MVAPFSLRVLRRPWPAWQIQVVPLVALLLCHTTIVFQLQRA
jgi:hypothetical protein